MVLPGVPNAHVAQGHARRGALQLRQIVPARPLDRAVDKPPVTLRSATCDRLIGRRLGHYVVLRRSSAAAAWETCTSRRTPDSIAASRSSFPVRSRSTSADRLALVQREARAAAALNHPNIVHLYSVEEADGLMFITMELVQGRSLRQLLR